MTTATNYPTGREYTPADLEQISRAQFPRPLEELARRALEENPTTNRDGRYSEDELWELALELAGTFTGPDIAFELITELAAALEEPNE